MPNGLFASLSVVEEFGETVDSVTRDLGIYEYEVIGKGAIKNY